MTDRDTKNYLADVVEITNDFRSNPLLEGLRSAFAVKGYKARDLIMAGYLENEEGVVVGAILDKEKTAFEFEFSNESGQFVAIDLVDDLESVRSYLPALAVASTHWEFVCGQLF